MNYLQGFKSKFLKTADLDPATDTVVTIKRCGIEKIGRGDDDKEDKLVLHFEEIEQSLSVNRSNGDIIAGMYGPETNEWIGEPIALYVNPHVMYAGKKVGGIGVRDRKPARSRQPAQLTYPRAVAAVIAAGASELDLRNYLKSCGIAGWSPSTAAQCADLAAKFIAGIGAPPDDNDPIPF